MNKKNADLELAKEFDDNLLVDFMVRHGRTILYIILGLLSLFLVAYIFSLRSTTKAEMDYFNAEIEFKRFQKDFRDFESPSLSPSFVQLKTILERRPDLHAKYDALIAQILIEAGEPQAAEPFANRTFQRVKSDPIHDYIDYAKNSVSISLNEYEEALKKAIDLNSTLLTAHTNEKNPLFMETLYLYNLLRLAFLNAELGNKEAELIAWQTFEKYGEDVSNSSAFDKQEAFQLVVNTFANGKASLLNFIEQRQKILKN